MDFRSLLNALDGETKSTVDVSTWPKTQLIHHHLFPDLLHYRLLWTLNGIQPTHSTAHRRLSHNLDGPFHEFDFMNEVSNITYSLKLKALDWASLI